MKRYGMVIKVKPEKLEEYKKLHANPWEGVLKTIRDCNIKFYLSQGWLSIQLFRVSRR